MELMIGGLVATFPLSNDMVEEDDITIGLAADDTIEIRQAGDLIWIPLDKAPALFDAAAAWARSQLAVSAANAEVAA